MTLDSFYGECRVRYGCLWEIDQSIAGEMARDGGKWRKVERDGGRWRDAERCGERRREAKGSKHGTNVLINFHKLLVSVISAWKTDQERQQGRK